MNKGQDLSFLFMHMHTRAIFFDLLEIILKQSVYTLHTVFPRSLPPFCIVTYHVEWVKAFWTYRMSCGGNQHV